MPNEPAPRHGRARMYPGLRDRGRSLDRRARHRAPGRIAQYTFVLLTLSSMVATVIGGVRSVPSHRWPFVVILGGFFLFVAGGAARQEHEHDRQPDLVAVHRAGCAHVPGLRVARTRVARLRVARRGGFDFDSLLDALLVALAALAFVWSYLIAPPAAPARAAEGAPGVGLLSRDVGVHGGDRDADRLRRRKGRPLAQRLLLVALSMMVIGDVIYMFVDSRIATLPGGLLDLPYALAFLAFGIGVLHPSMRELVRAGGELGAAPTKARLALVSIALGLPVVVILSKLPKNTGDRVALVIISLVLTSAAILRVFRSLRAHARSEERLTEQATHDALTRLPNRFLVFERVTRMLGAAARE